MRAARVLAAAAAGASLVVIPTVTAVAEPTPLTSTGTVRVSGADRYATSSAVSQASFTAPQDAVFVASGQNFPDALAGGAAAAKRSAPLLLTANSQVPTTIVTELKRLRPGKIYVLGGTGAVSGVAASSLSAIAPTQRLGGADRYATAAAISKVTFPTAETVYLASGSGFADALSGGPAAAKEDAPLLLTGASSLPSATRAELARLKPSRVKVLGGTGAVSSAVQDQVRKALPGATVTRYAGADRYATAASVARGLWPDGSPTVFYASGTGFPDGLSGTPAAAVNSAPLLLSTKTCMPNATADATKALSPALRAFVGGSGAISTSGTACKGKMPPPPPTRDFDCGDFATWAKAQAKFDEYYPGYGDIFNLDADNDRVACELLPGAP